jgi:hypothetical protein
VGEQLAEFVTLMWFDSLADVQAFAGADYEVAVVPPAARWNKERGWVWDAPEQGGIH